MQQKLKDREIHLRILFIRFKKRIIQLTNFFLFSLSLFSIFLLVLEFGYKLDASVHIRVDSSFTLSLLLFFVISTIRFVFNYKEVIHEKLLLIDISSYVLLFLVLLATVFLPEKHLQYKFLNFLTGKGMEYTLIALLSVINISKFIFRLLSAKLNPSMLFIYSFFAIIMLGTGLLMLPNSTLPTINLRFVDALFTATTSVCVTGLCTVDVSQTFTFMGQVIILSLIQIGGVGVMTFTSFFALSFMGKYTYGGSILLKDFLNEDNLGNMFTTLKNILIVTFIIEGIGAYLIWQSIHGTINASIEHEIFASVFHAISAFCNAGISIFHGNLGNTTVLYNFVFQFWISILIVLGGLGFPIVFNYMKLLRHFVVNHFKVLMHKQDHYIHIPRIISLHTRVVMISTFILLLVGTAVIFFMEKDHTFAGLGFPEKLTAAFFTAVTPRTAGYTTFDMTTFASPTLFFILILMMIGAAPMSTGGGMKVTSVSIALLSAIDIARGKKRVEIGGQEIDPWYMDRSGAVIILYLVWMMFATCILTGTEKGVSPFTLLFEVVSALSTVGLSLNFSPELSDAGKYIIISSMFVGRIGVLTFLSGMLKRYQPKNYRYPKAGLIIG